MKHTLLFLYLLSIVACSKSDNAAPTSALMGTWRLSTYCKPGNSTCTSVDVPSDKGVFVTFGYNGEFNEFYENTKPVEYSFLGCGSGDYKMEGKDIRIIALCMSSTNGRLMKLVSIANNRLVLNPFGTGEYIFVK
ncbi:lipocalin family protein [Spirosoma flavum]|uniref:Lipocalin family protein n=1 Tax=Spirosoma flavum TaxID=2048557 RepID=A0ABW6AR63_9BACT